MEAVSLLSSAVLWWGGQRRIPHHHNKKYNQATAGIASICVGGIIRVFAAPPFKAAVLF
jgi:hypothetical protein